MEKKQKASYSIYLSIYLVTARKEMWVEPELFLLQFVHEAYL